MAEIDKFIHDNKCDPEFWLNVMKTAAARTDCREKYLTIQNAINKLKLYIDFVSS